MNLNLNFYYQNECLKQDLLRAMERHRQESEERTAKLGASFFC